MTLQTTSPHERAWPASCTIVPAEPADLESLCHLDPDAMADYRQRDFVASAIEDGRCWVAFFDETLVAYGVFNYQFHGYGVIHHVFVWPGFRRRGIGRALVDYFSAACSSPRLYITVPQSELAMQELLRTRGFVLSGGIREYGDEGTALIYVKDLLTATPALEGRGVQ